MIVIGPGEMCAGVHYSTVMGYDSMSLPPPPSDAAVKASITKLEKSVLVLSAHVARLEDAMEISPRLDSLRESLVWRTAALEGSDVGYDDEELPPLSFFWNLDLRSFHQASKGLAANKFPELRAFLIACKEGYPKVVTVAKELLKRERETLRDAEPASE